MPSIKIHLEKDELAPIQRLATELKVNVEDIAYAGLDQLMRSAGDETARKLMERSQANRRACLPSWADRPREIHAYESMT